MPINITAEGILRATVGMSAAVLVGLGVYHYLVEPSNIAAALLVTALVARVMQIAGF